MKYIDAEKLIEEIKGLQCEQGFEDGEAERGYQFAIDDVLCTIASLQHEQPDVDFDFQVFAKEMDAVFNLPKEVTENTEEEPLNWEYAIARHFYKLGLNARKK